VFLCVIRFLYCFLGFPWLLWVLVDLWYFLCFAVFLVFSGVFCICVILGVFRVYDVWVGIIQSLVCFLFCSRFVIGGIRLSGNSWFSG